MAYFDYRKAARRAQLSARDLARIEKAVRWEFPKDDMMFELHVLRVCQAIGDGYTTLEEVLADRAPARH